MSKQTKNDDLECHAFKAQCSMSYFVIELDGEALCLLCYDILAVLKECNKHLDYQTKHCHSTPN